ncbi:unnamed protein product [Nyctereutes procyonoides]|uniref:(raccoon dog) hypothetical protein n=1 Tax=Nyctereutes procyonoides TaxID=34880 RepID=A0A811ZS56_NYCPR|nr:unnamed protein product [Nyctereutes procyonoides]
MKNKIKQQPQEASPYNSQEAPGPGGSSGSHGTQLQGCESSRGSGWAANGGDPGARNSEARGDVPGPTGRRALLKGKGGSGSGKPGSGSSQPGPAARRAGGGEQRGQAGQPAAARPTSPAAGVSLPARRGASRPRPRARAPGPRPGPSHRLGRSRLPIPQARTQAGRPETLRSSSKQAAGRARPGRGPRVTRKPQAAQVEPGRRHRKSRASPLPFLRGDLVTGKREVPPTGGSQRTSEARAAQPAAAGAGRVHRDPGRGREEGRAGAGRGSCGGQPSSAEAEQIDSPGGDPSGRHAGRCGDRAAGRVAATTGTPWPCWPRTPSSAVAFRSRSRPQRPRTRAHARAACCAPRLHTSRAPAGRPHAHAPRPTPHAPRRSRGRPARAEPPAAPDCPGGPAPPAAPPAPRGRASRRPPRACPGRRAARTSPRGKPLTTPWKPAFSRIISIALTRELRLQKRKFRPGGVLVSSTAESVLLTFPGGLWLCPSNALCFACFEKKTCLLVSHSLGKF